MKSIDSVFKNTATTNEYFKLRKDGIVSPKRNTSIAKNIRLPVSDRESLKEFKKEINFLNFVMDLSKMGRKGKK